MNDNRWSWYELNTRCASFFRLATRISYWATMLLVLIARQSSAQGLSPVFGAALQGDMASALNILDSLDAGRFSNKDSVTAQCIRTTFTTPPQDEDLPPISRAVLSAYRSYWQVVMLRRTPTKEAEAQLLASLKTILANQGNPDTTFTSLDFASEAARVAITREGLFALAGVTSPYYELMLWKKQSPKTYHVQLPERAIDAHVVFLDSFISLGWAGYATCGLAHSGGWATKDSLFAVLSAYDTTSEDFRVSYLAHEAQHFSDYGQFPQLEQPELEYRAKLTELAESEESTLGLIQTFAEYSGQDRAVPHHLANFWVVKDLSRNIFDSSTPVSDTANWSTVPPRRLRHESERLLRQNSDALHRAGATTVNQFLGTDLR